MLGRSKYDIANAIYQFEAQVHESFADYFLDNYPFGSWAYWLLGKGYNEVANDLINRNEEGLYLTQEEKFMFPYQDHPDGTFDHAMYDFCVSLWAEYIMESDQYFRRFKKFIDENKVKI